MAFLLVFYLYILLYSGVTHCQSTHDLPSRIAIVAIVAVVDVAVYAFLQASD